jgi:hypothetical protein
VTVAASNGEMTGGIIDVFPSQGHGPECQTRGPLFRDAVIISGTCSTPFASDVLAVYSLSMNVNADPLARANLPWS